MADEKSDIRDFPSTQDQPADPWLETRRTSVVLKVGEGTEKNEASAAFIKENKPEIENTFPDASEEGLDARVPGALFVSWTGELYIVFHSYGWVDPAYNNLKAKEKAPAGIYEEPGLKAVLLDGQTGGKDLPGLYNVRLSASL